MKKGLSGRRIRLISVYGTTLRILSSYALLHLMGLVLGNAWKKRRENTFHAVNARRVRKTILKLKGLFIKLGQLISILTNFLPQSFRDELEDLQDRIPPRPFAEIKARVQEELGRPPAELFAEFEETPVASASLAQVHKARMHDGNLVAVKIQHLDIEETARLDLKALYRVFSLIGWLFQIHGLRAQYEQISAMIQEELDFTQEADYINQIASNFSGTSGVGFPQVVQEFSTRRVLTTHFIEGIKATNIEQLKSLHIDTGSLANKIVETYCQMIFRDGLYHADPHPGNIFIQPDGGIVFIDFGAVARLSPAMKEGIPQFLIGVLRRNPDLVLQAIKQMGFISHRQDEKTALELIDYFYERFIDKIPVESINLSDINAESAIDSKLEALDDLKDLNISLRELMNAFQVPRDWVLLERTILLLLGLCTHLHPTMNPMETIRPYLEATVLGPDKTWRQFASEALKDIARSAISIPDEMRRLLVRANKGELEVQIQGLQRSTLVLYALGQQFLFGFMTLGSGFLAYLGRQNGDQNLSTIATACCIVFILCLLGTVGKARRILKKKT